MTAAVAAARPVRIIAQTVAATFDSASLPG